MREINEQCTENARGMLRNGKFLGYAVENTTHLYWCVDGKVWKETPGKIYEMGDYFLFMQKVRADEIRMYADEIVGSLHSGHRFTCKECDPTGTPVFRVNLGIYSQTCSKCHKLIVDGVKKSNGGPLCLFDGR